MSVFCGHPAKTGSLKEQLRKMRLGDPGVGGGGGGCRGLHRSKRNLRRGSGLQRSVTSREKAPEDDEGLQRQENEGRSHMF